MRLSFRWLSLMVLLILITSSFSVSTAISSPQPAQPGPWQTKVDPWVLETATKGETEFIIFLAEQADLSGAASLKTKLEKGTYVYQRLTEVAARTQPPVLAALESLGVEHRPYWVANMIWVRASMDAVRSVAQRADVAHLYANPIVHFEEPSVQTGPIQPDAIEWNIQKVNAPGVWAAGYTGQGAVVAGQDTGYDWDHPALINKYRGWSGSVANHNYNWHDAIHSGGGVCGANSTQPCDDHGHGTHTMGTMVGDDGAGNQIGMAPGAKWIGCRNMDQGAGTPTTYSECYQWFIAPTDLNNLKPRPELAPDVINNSWGCPDSEGCTDPNVLLTVVQNVRAAGIVTAHSAGNDGSSCGSIDTPAAIYTESFTVGATNSADTIAGFSSRGPVTVDGSNRQKPNISAPGVNIRSSYPGGGYQGGWSGTSMAAPHVAGLVALLISAEPALAGQVSEIEALIEHTAVPRTTTENCGGLPGSQVPNNTYGWGRINALAAFNGRHFMTLEKTASPGIVAPGETLTYTLTIHHSHYISPTTNVVLTDTLPANTTFVAATLPYTLNGHTVKWELPSLGPGAAWNAILSVRVPVTYTGTIVNTSYGVHSDDVAIKMGTPVLTEIHNLAILKTASPGIVSPGGWLTYTMTVTNLHPTAVANHLVLTDVLPTHTTFITATGDYILNNGVVKWETPSLAPGAVWSVKLTVQVAVTTSDPIVNAVYGVRSDEVISPIMGLPVSTPIRRFIYLPIVAKMP